MVGQFAVIHHLQQDVKQVRVGLFDFVEQQHGMRMLVDRIEKTLEGHPVVQVFARVQLIASVDPVRVKHVEDRLPPAAQLGKAFFDEARRALRPGIDHVPHQRAREGRVGSAAEALAGFRGHVHLAGGPFSARRNIAVELQRGKTVELLVEGRMGGDQLALKMRRKLGDFDAVLRTDADHLIDICLAFRRLLQIEQPRIPGRNLHALVAEIAHVFRD